MARHLFIAQQTLSIWMDEEKIEFDGSIMTIKADGRTFRLVEAVRFIKVEGGEEDPACLLGKVKTNDQLKSLGAERYRDSVLCEDVAYRVQEGFVGEVFLNRIESQSQRQTSTKDTSCHEKTEPRPIAHARTQPQLKKVQESTQQISGAAKQPVAKEPGKKGPGKTEDLSDEELLTRFLLDNL